MTTARNYNIDRIFEIPLDHEAERTAPKKYQRQME